MSVRDIKLLLEAWHYTRKIKTSPWNSVESPPLNALARQAEGKGLGWIYRRYETNSTYSQIRDKSQVEYLALRANQRAETR